VKHIRQKMKWIFWWHAWRRHDVYWMACGTWITSVECYTCWTRWEDLDPIEKMRLVPFSH